MTPLPVHPIADAFPEMAPDRFGALKADIEKHGRVLVPAMLWQGQIVDGRHRARACDELGLTCPTLDVECGEDELPALVWSLNGERRDLTVSQRAMVGAKMANLSIGRPKVIGSTDPIIPIAKAAEIAGVSRPSVVRAMAILSKGDTETIEKVERGEMGLQTAAASVWKRNPKPPRAPKPDNVVQIATSPMRRVFTKPANDILGKAIGLVGEMARQIDAYAANAAPDEDARRVWREALDEALPILKQFRKSLNTETDNGTPRSRSA